MQLTINGDARSFEMPLTIAALLDQLDSHPSVKQFGGGRQPCQPRADNNRLRHMRLFRPNLKNAGQNPTRVPGLYDG